MDLNPFRVTQGILKESINFQILFSSNNHSPLIF